MNGLRLTLGGLAAVLVLPAIALAIAFAAPGSPASHLQILHVVLTGALVSGAVTFVSCVVIVAVLLGMRRLNAGLVLLWGMIAGVMLPLLMLAAMQISGGRFYAIDGLLVFPMVGGAIAGAACLIFCLAAGVSWRGAFPGPQPEAPRWRLQATLVGSGLVLCAAVIAVGSALVTFSGTVPVPGQPWTYERSSGMLTPNSGETAGFRVGQTRAAAFLVACARGQTTLQAIDLNCAQGRVDPDGVAESRPLRSGEDESWSFRVNLEGWSPCIGLDSARLSVVLARGRVARLEANCAGRPFANEWDD
jgi:hypothetical protein